MTVSAGPGSGLREPRHDSVCRLIESPESALWWLNVNLLGTEIQRTDQKERVA